MMLTRNCLASATHAVSQNQPAAPYPKRARQSGTPCGFRRTVVQNVLRSAARCEPCLAEGAERAPCNPRQCQWCTRASQAGATHKNKPMAVIRTVSVHSAWSPCVNEARSASTCRCRHLGCPQTANKVSDHPWRSPIITKRNERCCKSRSMKPLTCLLLCVRVWAPVGV